MCRVQILEAFLPWIFSGEPGDLKDEEIFALETFQLDNGIDLSTFSVVDNPQSGEWITNFSRCDVLNVQGQIVYLTDDPAEIRAVRRMYFIDEGEEAWAA